MPVRASKTIPIKPAARRRPSTRAGEAVPIPTMLTAPVVLDVPQIFQEQTQWCWAACAQMVAAFLGNADVRQCELANFLHEQTKCCNKPGSTACNQPCPYDGIEKVFTHLRIHSISHNWAVNPQVLMREFQANRPVEIGLLWFGGGGHVAIVRGVTERGLLAVNDPWFGQGVATYMYLALAYGQGEWAYSFGDFRSE